MIPKTEGAAPAAPKKKKAKVPPKKKFSLKAVRVHGFQGYLVVNDTKDYCGFVFIKKDPNEGKRWKCITAVPLDEYEITRYSLETVEEGAAYLVGLI